MNKRVCFALLALALATSGFPFGQNKIVYDDFDWKIHTTTHFEIHHYTENPELLAKMASYAESAYEDLSRRFSFQIEDPIPLVFYETHAEFRQTNINPSFIPEGVGAFAEPARNRMVLPVDIPDKDLQELILHELTHIFEYEILFQGSLRKARLARPPLWFMEGLASYMADDEDARDQMVIRDAVVHNLIPEISSRGIGGFFAYRFGHAAFDFVEDRWGEDGVRDLVFEFRTTLGSAVSKALKRAFDTTPEDFDVEFRRWLRKKYLPELVEHGEPIDFGKQVRLARKLNGNLMSSVPSPSGDLAAGFIVENGSVKIAVFGVRDRQYVKKLTNGREAGTEYPIVQFLTVGPTTARDLAWSPEGDRIAYFARKERDRKLLVINAISGKVLESYPIEPGEPLSPSFAPDGRTVVFHAVASGQSDIWQLDLASGAQVNLTNDSAWDTSPMIDPGGQWLYYSAVDEDRMKIFRMSLDDHTIKQRVTSGPGDDEDLSFTPDGGRIFFSSSSEDGIYNIQSLDLATGQRELWTDAVGGSFTPWFIDRGPDPAQLLFTGFYRGEYGAYVGELNTPEKIVREAAEVLYEPAEGVAATWYPDIEVPIDPADTTDYGRGRLFLDDVQVLAGITDDSRFYSFSQIAFSDTLGNRRAYVSLRNVDSFTNYEAGYMDFTNRLQKALFAYWQEDFYVSVQLNPDLNQEIRRDRIQRNAGLTSVARYPLDKHHRLEFNLGFQWRKIDLPFVISDNDGGTQIVFENRSDSFPRAGLGFVGDTTEWRSWGPHRGRRYEIKASYAADIESKSPDSYLFWDAELDYRQYLPVTRRSQFALRVFGGMSDGISNQVYRFGGLDTLRGFEYRELIGNRAAYANIEYRFPLLDEVRVPGFSFRDIRGRVFLDVGAAWLDDLPFDFVDDDDRLKDGLASYGWGFSWNLGGLALNWDFAWRHDGQNTVGDRRSSFWIGSSF